MVCRTASVFGMPVCISLSKSRSLNNNLSSNEQVKLLAQDVYALFEKFIINTLSCMSFIYIIIIYLIILLHTYFKNQDRTKTNQIEAIDIVVVSNKHT